jgi:DNA polymerase
MQYAGITDVYTSPDVISLSINVTKNDETDIREVSTEVSTEAVKLHEEIEIKEDNHEVNTNVKSKIESAVSIKTESELSSENLGDKLTRLKLLSEEVAECSRCPELVKSRSQTVFGTGDPDSRLLFLGEAPGADEDIQGIPFVGRSGKLLDDIITKGMKIRREDVYICNILRCRPPGNRPPAIDEASNCRHFFEKTIKIVNPQFICCLGSVATRYLLQTDKSIGLMRGRVHDYNGIKVICTYHPSYLLRLPSAKKDAWEDVKLLMKIMGLESANS